MSATSPGRDQVCPECGTILSAQSSQCSACGCVLDGPSRRVGRDRANARLPFLENLGPLVKLVAIVAAVALIGWGIYAGVQALWRDVAETSPYPTDPDVTVTEFFTGLQPGDTPSLQACYGLLTSERKAATVIGQQSRGDGYFPHFLRIRDYLVQRVGEDFTSQMKVDPDGRRVEFVGPRGWVVLSIRLRTVKGLDEANHYALQEINEFPIDAAPGIGLEAHNRGLGRAIDTMGSVSSGQDQDASEIIRRLDYENQRERLERLIQAVEAARQLDTRHTVFDWILQEFPTDKLTHRMLFTITDSETHEYPPNLREIARAYLADWPQR